MIDASFQFEADFEPIIGILLSLPPTLRPVHFGYSETRRNKSQRVDDTTLFRTFRSKAKLGFFLFGPKGVVYNLTERNSRICECYLRIEPELVIELVLAMSTARPTFGYASAEAERKSRNFIFVQTSQGSTETFLGRDLRKYIPGLYWLTLLSDELARRHAMIMSQSVV